jgi:hypothetical protein
MQVDDKSDDKEFLAKFAKSSPRAGIARTTLSRNLGSHLKYYYETDSAIKGSFSESKSQTKESCVPNTTSAALFHETMKHRNELMRREAGY